MALHGLTHWGVAKRQGNGFWSRDRWFESATPAIALNLNVLLVKSLSRNNFHYSFRPDFTTFKSNLLSNGFIFRCEVLTILGRY